jgi:hypothetical protein
MVFFTIFNLQIQSSVDYDDLVLLSLIFCSKMG